MTVDNWTCLFTGQQPLRPFSCAHNQAPIRFRQKQSFVDRVKPIMIICYLYCCFVNDVNHSVISPVKKAEIYFSFNQALLTVLSSRQPSISLWTKLSSFWKYSRKADMECPVRNFSVSVSKREICSSKKRTLALRTISFISFSPFSCINDNNSLWMEYFSALELESMRDFLWSICSILAAWIVFIPNTADATCRSKWLGRMQSEISASLSFTESLWKEASKRHFNLDCWDSLSCPTFPECYLWYSRTR